DKGEADAVATFALSGLVPVLFELAFGYACQRGSLELIASSRTLTVRPREAAASDGIGPAASRSRSPEAFPELIKTLFAAEKTTSRRFPRWSTRAVAPGCNLKETIWLSPTF